MDLIHTFADFILHLDEHLHDLFLHYGPWTYAVLALILFCETGLVITPFLPGDSLLFAVGALAAGGGLKLSLLFPILAGAVILGDNTNYLIGSFIGPKAFTGKSRLFKREYLEKTHRFYEKYGVKTIVLARFMPIIRTFAPFVAGIGRMAYLRFLAFSVIGGLFWIGLFLCAGYFFGNIPFVKKNFELVIIGIILVSLTPPVIEYLRSRRKSTA